MAGTRAKDASDSSAEQTKSTNTSSRTSSFVAKAKKNGILLNRSKRPTNFKDMNDKLLQRRNSEPPTESEFKLYKRRILRATNEGTIVPGTVWLLLKEYDREGNGNDDDKPYIFAMNQPFADFPHAVGFNNAQQSISREIGKLTEQGLCIMFAAYLQ
ncbi:hypothetical protein F4801DRAFT_415953 [Xylaria longipes]|nr:hypothetical protein F4801DRAFT_415953 [Xylaria longipes]